MEKLIRRAMSALGANVSASEVISTLVVSGVTAEDAFLATRAAEIMLTPWEVADRATLTDIPRSTRNAK